MRFEERCKGELPVETDEQAHSQLPPFAIVHNAYYDYRRSGNAPADALRRTLELWREFQADARPKGYRQK